VGQSDGEGGLIMIINTFNHARITLVEGTSGQGLIDTDYATLKKVFGKPADGGSDKIRKHWTIKIDGVVCTIYDYKQGKKYSSKYSVPLKYANWSVGGNSKLSHTLVQGAIDNYNLRIKVENQ